MTLRLLGRGRKPELDADLRSINAMAGTVYCLVGEDQVVRSITPNASVVLGEACDRAAELQLRLEELLRPESGAELEAWVAAAWLPELPAGCLLATNTVDGQTRWLELHTPGRLDTGGADALVIELREVTARAERQRRTELLATALEAVDDAVYITDADGYLEYVNPAFLRLSGYREADVLGQPVSMLGSGRHRPEFFERMWELLGRGEPYSGEVVNQRQDGSLFTLDLAITPLPREGSAQQRFIAVGRDITERKRIEREFEDLAYFDSLTGVANARLLRERARQMLALARRQGNIAALLHVDLERLQSVNQQHGRAIGDEVLRTVAERLRQGLRESDVLARLGSDEFLILLSEVADEESIGRVVRRLHDSITRPFRIHNHSITIQSRFGIGLYPQDAGTYDELLDCAEAAVSRARQAQSSFEFFERSQSIASHERLLLEDDLHWAWEHDQFILHYQPIVGADGRIVGAEALARGEVVGIEALARWPHLERGMLAPAQFIPLAEQTGRILSLDRWAIATAVRQAASWKQHDWDGWIAVNLSTRTLHDPELPDYIERTLSAYDLQPGCLVVEITENTAMRDPGLTATVLQALRKLGVLIAVDDFGVGHSSLAYLKLFPIDILKLDASFIRGLGTGSRDEQLVEIMISLAHRIGARVVAEGVEEAEQLEWLRNARCDYIQGFLIGMPAPAETMLQQHQQARA
jgi:diguanylate cyclase (GGDEF)-like protein/PAS domain S-box-containing protein